MHLLSCHKEDHATGAWVPIPCAKLILLPTPKQNNKCLLFISSLYIYSAQKTIIYLYTYGLYIFSTQKIIIKSCYVYWNFLFNKLEHSCHSQKILMIYLFWNMIYAFFLKLVQLWNYYYKKNLLSPFLKKTHKKIMMTKTNLMIHPGSKIIILLTKITHSNGEKKSTITIDDI